MLLGIDHLVVAVRSVEAAEGELADALGLAFTGGGRHEAWGTYNRLAFLGDSYLELIGVLDRQLVLGGSGAVGRAALEHLDRQGNGLATYALAVADLGRAVAALREAGSPIGDPVAGSRVRPDGEVVRWSTAWAALGPDRAPFLIEHEPVGPEWGSEARAARAAFAHPGGGRMRLSSLEVPVRDVESAADEYGRALGIAFSEGWVTALGGQSLELIPEGDVPVVRMVGDPGTEPLDVTSHGIRWIRVPAVDP
jgi:hypothetical protein